MLFDTLGYVNTLVSYLLDSQTVRGSSMYAFGYVTKIGQKKAGKRNAC